MILDEDPAMLIKATIGNFNVEPDKRAMTRVRSSLAELEERRSAKIVEAEKALKRLARHEDGLRAAHSEAVSSHSAASHAASILHLDSEKFRVAKAVSDLETEGERLSAELESLRARRAELDMQGVEGDEVARERREADDPAVLKLKVFRSLGVDVEADGTTGQRRAVVRSRKLAAGGGKGDVHVVTVDPSEARSYYANYFWDVI